MYRCSVCGTCSKPNQSRKVWVIEREVPHTVVGWDGERQIGTRTEIERELPVCNACYLSLSGGISLDWLRQHQKTKPGPVVLDEWPEEVREVYR